MASGLTRLGISMSKDGAKKLSELAVECETSQSGFIESVVWLISEDAELRLRARHFIEERAKVEEELIALARTNTAEARKLLAKVRG